MQADAPPLLTLGLLGRCALDLACTTALVRGVYYRRHRSTALFLTLYAFNLVIFLVAYLLNRVEMSLGAAFGLFAVFSMLRYRTEGLSARDMTYLFLVIALGLLLGISHGRWYELVAIGALFPSVVAVLESRLVMRGERAEEVLYDDIRLVNSGRREELLADLRVRTGLPIERVEVREIDLVKAHARLTAYYREP
jgi:hypothetical protein